MSATYSDIHQNSWTDGWSIRIVMTKYIDWVAKMAEISLSWTGACSPRLWCQRGRFASQVSFQSLWAALCRCRQRANDLSATFLAGTLILSDQGSPAPVTAFNFNNFPRGHHLLIQHTVSVRASAFELWGSGVDTHIQSKTDGQRNG